MQIRFDPRDLVIAERVPFENLLPLFPLRPTVRVLIVADTSVSFTTSFGVGKVIDLIRANVDGYVRFDVDLARLGVQGSTLLVDSTPGAKEAKYTNFRFSSQVNGDHVLDDYDEVWCFGFAPGNDGSSDDGNISSSPYASTDQDLAVLTQWMNAGGGVLAMGDHHYLGAAMCGSIPRVRSMRRWSNAQGVPPINGPERLDTHRPQNPAQDPSIDPTPDVIPSGAQSDDVPQVIDWKRYSVWAPFIFERRYRPHPVLCGGDLGVIDVLPDHAHEGWIYEDHEIDLGATYSFAGTSGDEYPSAGGAQPSPEVIAWANTLPDPPYNHAKGPAPARRFGVIGAYDGDAVDVGRVLVDSTWHHWMDINLNGLDAESPDTEFQKIARYFRNCAVWLAREHQRQRMLQYSTFWGLLHATAFEEFGPAASLHLLGGKAIDVIGRLTSECLVRDWINIFVPVRLREELRIPHPIPDPCWSCPPFELLQRAVLGGVVEQFLPLRRELQQLQQDPDCRPDLSPEHFAAAAEKGAAKGLEVFHEAVSANIGRLRRVEDLRGEPCRVPAAPALAAQE